MIQFINNKLMLQFINFCGIFNSKCELYILFYSNYRFIYAFAMINFQKSTPE